MIPTKVCAYGAGYVAEKALPILQQRFDVLYIMDRSPEKCGETLHDIPIVTLDAENSSRYPVMILMFNLESAIEALAGLKCKSQILLVSWQNGYCYLWEYRHKFARIRDNVIHALKQNDPSIIADLDSDFSFAEITETNNKFQPHQGRIFNLVSEKETHAPGGPCACLRNLYLSNEEYKLIPNFYSVTFSYARVPEGGIHPDSKSFISPAESNASLLESFYGYLDNLSLGHIMEIYSRLHYTWGSLLKIHEKFCFSENDTFLLQDIFMVHTFIHMFPQCKKTVHASHAQGTFASERGRNDSALENYYNEIQLEHLNKVPKWIFPSKGAAGGFLRTANDKMKKAAKTCEFHIAYNGYEPKHTISPDKKFLEFLNNIKDTDIVLASATLLYKNKGVERIPKFLADLKRLTNLSIHWILVGGGEMEGVVEEEINKHLEQGDYTWFKKRFDNQDNIFALFARADFYIMMQHVSVFDLSTLQAMAYGCVPILSNVDGNLEFCGFENGLLVDPERRDDTAFLHLLEGYVLKTGSAFEVDSSFLEQKKQKNKKIVKNKFNNKAFLLSYRGILFDVSHGGG